MGYGERLFGFDVLPLHNALAEERKSERQKAEDGRLINRGYPLSRAQVDDLAFTNQESGAGGP
jgi:hypothetical protein